MSRRRAENVNSQGYYIYKQTLSITGAKRYEMLKEKKIIKIKVSSA